MKRATWFGAMGVGLVALAAGGCEPPSTPDGLAREMLSHVNALTASFDKQEPFEKQWSLITKIKAAGEKFEKLKITDEERELLRRRHYADFVAATNRLQPAAGKAVAANPQLEQPLNDVAVAITKVMPALGSVR